MDSRTCPLVSFGLPVYNGEAYLAESLSSLLAQDYPNFEIVICDNCSTDRTPEICQQYAKADSRVIYHRNATNVGAAGNFNLAFERSKGTLFAWANHDDLWGESYLSGCVSALDSTPGAVLAYSCSAKIDGEGEVVAPLMCQLGLDDPDPHTRLRRFHDLFREIDRRKGWSAHEIEGLWIPVYGVMRADALRQTDLIGPYISSDTILLEELLLRGAFVEVPDQLFFKRDHEARSMRASLSYDKRIDWFTGNKPGRLIFPRWRLLAERLRAARRSGGSGRDAWKAHSEMLSFYVRRPHEGKALIKEILINGLRLFQPILRKLKLGRQIAPQKW